MNLLRLSRPSSPVYCLLETSLSSNGFFCWAVVQFEFLLKNISSNMWQNFAHSFVKGYMHNSVRHVYYLYTLSFPEYSAFVQHWRSREATCFTWTSDSSLLKLALNFLISSVKLDIVLLVRFYILRNKTNNTRLDQRFESFFCVNTRHHFIQQ